MAATTVSLTARLSRASVTCVRKVNKYSAKGAIATAAAATAGLVAVALAGDDTLPAEYGGRTRWMPPSPLAQRFPMTVAPGTVQLEELQVREQKARGHRTRAAALAA